MEKRVFLAILLSFAVLALYQAYLAPPPTPRLTESGPPETTAPPSPTTTPPTPPATPPGTSPTSPPVSDPAAPAPVEPAAVPLVADTEPRDIVVETDAVRAVFSSRGAVLTSWQLKHYTDHNNQSLELVPRDIPAAFARPFTLVTDDEALSATLSTALYLPSATSLTLGSSPGTLSFHYQDAGGLNARKTFHFQQDGNAYLVGVEASVDVDGASRPVTLHWGPALSFGYKQSGSSEIESRALMFQGDEIERPRANDLLDLIRDSLGSIPEVQLALNGQLAADTPEVRLALDLPVSPEELKGIVDRRPDARPRFVGQMALAGVEEHYFMAAALPGTEMVQVDYLPLTLPVSANPDVDERTYVDFSLTVPGAATMSYFMGPKDFDVLRAVDPQFTRAIDFGIFGALIVPMLQALKWLNGFIGNYGWSIVALTILINLLMFPLRHRSMVSMRKMQKLQPEIKALQERYKKYKITDPERQKMNQEMMALYKQKGVNPASGCVPMLLTMPVMISFYWMLQLAIELRGAPFFGWIQDLSVQDPYFIWPVLMGASMFWQMKISPTTADPTQAKIFMFMPVMFTFMFLWFPSGLVIYWLTSNLMAVGQQYITNRTIGAAGPAPAAAKDAPKSVGSAKTQKAKRRKLKS